MKLAEFCVSNRMGYNLFSVGSTLGPKNSVLYGPRRSKLRAPTHDAVNATSRADSASV